MTDSITYVYSLNENTLKLMYLSRRSGAYIETQFKGRRGRKARGESKNHVSGRVRRGKRKKGGVDRCSYFECSSTYNGGVSASSGMSGGSKNEGGKGLVVRETGIEPGGESE